VPQKKLITTGPFAVVMHPLYTSVALLVIPGAGLLFDSWVGFGIGAVLYASSRLFSPSEEVILGKVFPTEYPLYRRKVLLPWL
jgi:protein-S-isoprenylcysteine O-methyltransferase Ste14